MAPLASISTTAPLGRVIVLGALLATLVLSRAPVPDGCVCAGADGVVSTFVFAAGGGGFWSFEGDEEAAACPSTVAVVVATSRVYETSPSGKLPTFLPTS